MTDQCKNVNINIVTSPAQLLDEFEQYIKYDRALSQGTIDLYLFLLKGFFRHIDNNDPLTASKEDIKSYLATLRDQGQCRSSVSNTICALRAFYRWAAYFHKSEAISDLYFYLSEIIKAKRDVPIKRIPNHDEVNAIRKAMDMFIQAESYRKSRTLIRYVRDRLMFEIIATTGARSIEIRRIKLRDFIIKESVCLLRGKGDRDRYCFLTDKTKELLARFLELEPKKDDDFLFPLSRPNALNLIWRNWERKAGVEPIYSSHSFRHYLVTEVQRRGLSLQDAADIAGHVNTQITRRVYTHIDPSMVRSKYAFLQDV